MILFTGERESDHFRVQVLGKPIALAYAPWLALIDLVLARSAGTGFLALNRVIVARLRKALEEALGPGMGKKLIETGCREEYRLTMEEGKILVGLDSTFAELEALHFLSEERASGLRKMARLETLVKPKRNRKEIDTPKPRRNN